ncbi:MAG: hypothetical protein AAFO07_02540 [Bacteroidota bacterium]
MKINTLLVVVMLLAIYSCQDTSTNSSTETENTEVDAYPTPDIQALPIIVSMDKAHNVNAFKEKEVLAFDLELYFQGKKRLDATIYSRTNSTAVKVSRTDGVQLIYKDNEIYKMPADAEYRSARFDALTWQYFSMAPFKFSDPGTNWQDLGDYRYTEGNNFPAARLTFDNGTGDAPDDWYITYQNPENDRLKALAYIVTFSATQEEAEEEPHAIIYDQYVMVDGIPFATQWTFTMWTEEKRIFDEIGNATIRNVRFLEETPDLFELGEDNAIVSR